MPASLQRVRVSRASILAASTSARGEEISLRRTGRSVFCPPLSFPPSRPPLPFVAPADDSPLRLSCYIGQVRQAVPTLSTSLPPFLFSSTLFWAFNFWSLRPLTLPSPSCPNLSLSSYLSRYSSSSALHYLSTACFIYRRPDQMLFCHPPSFLLRRKQHVRSIASLIIYLLLRSSDVVVPPSWFHSG